MEKLSKVEVRYSMKGFHFLFQTTDYDELRWKENGIFARMIKDQEIEKGEEIISSSESEDSFEAVT